MFNVTVSYGINMYSSFVIFSCLIITVFGLKAEDCPPNEIVDNCAAALCRNQQCTLIGKPVACPSVKECKPGCVCDIGYLRTYDGSCIPENDCDPQPCPNPREIYSTQKSACPKDTCETLSPDYKCDESQPPKSGCVCQSGFVRKDSTSPCDMYICECPQMANTKYCSFNNEDF